MSPTYSTQLHFIVSVWNRQKICEYSVICWPFENGVHIDILVVIQLDNR